MLSMAPYLNPWQITDIVAMLERNLSNYHRGPIAAKILTKLLVLFPEKIIGVLSRQMAKLSDRSDDARVIAMRVLTKLLPLASYLEPKQRLLILLELEKHLIDKEVIRKEAVNALKALASHLNIQQISNFLIRLSNGLIDHCYYGYRKIAIEIVGVLALFLKKKQIDYILPKLNNKLDDIDERVIEAVFKTWHALAPKLKTEQIEIILPGLKANLRKFQEAILKLLALFSLNMSDPQIADVLPLLEAELIRTSHPIVVETLVAFMPRWQPMQIDNIFAMLIRKCRYTIEYIVKEIIDALNKLMPQLSDKQIVSMLPLLHRKLAMPQTRYFKSLISLIDTLSPKLNEDQVKLFLPGLVRALAYESYYQSVEKLLSYLVCTGKCTISQLIKLEVEKYPKALLLHFFSEYFLATENQPSYQAEALTPVLR